MFEGTPPDAENLAHLEPTYLLVSLLNPDASDDLIAKFRHEKGASFAGILFRQITLGEFGEIPEKANKEGHFQPRRYANEAQKRDDGPNGRIEATRRRANGDEKENEDGNLFRENREETVFERHENPSSPSIDVDDEKSLDGAFVGFAKASDE